jgi:hypothetical protein
MFNETILDINDQLDNFFIYQMYYLLFVSSFFFREDKLQLET